MLDRLAPFRDPLEVSRQKLQLRLAFVEGGLWQQFELEESRRHELALWVFQQRCGLVAIHTLHGLDQHRTVEIGALHRSPLRRATSSRPSSSERGRPPAA